LESGKQSRYLRSGAPFLRLRITPGSVTRIDQPLILSDSDFRTEHVLLFYPKRWQRLCESIKGEVRLLSPVEDIRDD